MSTVIYHVLKEFFAEIHGHPVKARILSPVHQEESFLFQVSHYFVNKAGDAPQEPNAEFGSYANAERHLLAYLDAFQNTLDLGGEIAPGHPF